MKLHGMRIAMNDFHEQAYDRLLATDLNATVVVDLDDPLLQPLRYSEQVASSTSLPHVSKIAAQLRSRSGYRFIHKSLKDGPRSTSCTFFCAADIERSRKLSAERRDRESMVMAPYKSLLSFFLRTSPKRLQSKLSIRAYTTNTPI